MRILVLGQGGREHAILLALKESELKHQLYALPGNPGIANIAHCERQIAISDSVGILNFCLEQKIELVIIGPEDPLVSGLANELRKKGIAVVGPNQEAARLEGSKIFAKQFMQEANVPTAKFLEISAQTKAEEIKQYFSWPLVIKVDGLAAGKGVMICADRKAYDEATERIFIKKDFGKEPKALVEEFCQGYELSIILITNGKDYELLPIAQDHKRLFDNQEGPNTGGMGTVAPITLLATDLEKIKSLIIEPTINEINKRNYVYNGFLFIGIMMTDTGPMTLEYNCRLGDPETQAILPLIQNDLSEVLADLANGKIRKLTFKDEFTCCVVLSSQDYPNPSKREHPINIPVAQDENSWVIHAGTQMIEEVLYTKGGRILGAIGKGKTKKAALEKAYQMARKISFVGKHFRNDIGKLWP